VDVFAALHYLGTRVSVKWPFDQFRQGLDEDDPDARAKMLSSSLAAIKLITGTEKK
jgi:hypothetical protein